MTTSELPSWRLSSGVYLVQQEDVVRILDLDRGRFHGLDAIGSRMLVRTLAAGPEQAALEVARDYQVQAEEVRSDVETLLAGMERRRLLQRADAPSASTRRWLPGWLAGPCRVHPPVSVPLATRLLRRAWWSLRLDGWASSLERWSRTARPSFRIGPSEFEGTLSLVDGVIRDAAAGLLLFPVACKERALVGYHLLRVVFGLEADLVVGVRHYPFVAHAWVEVAGRIVTDDPGHCEGFEPVARFGCPVDQGSSS